MSTPLPPTWPDYLRGYAARQAGQPQKPPGALKDVEARGAWLSGWSSADDALRQNRPLIDAAAELTSLETPKRP